MNYLAHLYLAQPTADSHMGNLLGDFRKGVQLSNYNDSVLRGLGNHYLVDKYTDSHPIVRDAKLRFNKTHRRFSGIALDVLFDHFLIKNWHTYRNSTLSFDAFKQQSYALLLARQSLMPNRMAHVINLMSRDDWFEQYRSQAGIERAIVNISKRVRFKNDFANSVDDIRQHYDYFEHCFLTFFPQLQAHVKSHALESFGCRIKL